jgi:hypothetical protein
LLFAALGIRRLATWAWPSGRRAASRGADRLALALALAGGAAALTAYDAGIPYNEDWRGAARYIAEHGQQGDVVSVLSYIDRDPLNYYLDRAGAAGRFRVLDQNSPERAAWHGAVWAIFRRFGPDRNKPGYPFCGITVEHQGVPPDASLVTRLASQLGPNPTLLLGQCPSELIGDGWSPSETWGPNFAVRWATRRDATLWLPLSGAGAGRLTICLMPYTYPGAPPQSLQPSFGGHRLDAHGSQSA